MSIDIPLILVLLTVISGLIYLLDVLILARLRHASGRKMSVLVDYSRSLFPVFFIVLIIRSFLIQPFRVPSGSLEPTIQPGDFVAVSQFAYGLRLPVLHTKILNIGEPKRGDIVVFRFPGNQRIDYIKRVIGLPGDHIVYKNKELFINGKACPQKHLRKGIWFEPPKAVTPVVIKEENLLGKTHEIQLVPGMDISGDYDVVVPKGYYFMMGDNRDGSADSRYWGFVPEANLVGKALIIWMNWDGAHHTIHFSRIGTRL